MSHANSTPTRSSTANASESPQAVAQSLNPSSLMYVEQQWARYCDDQSSVDEDWQQFFASWDNGSAQNNGSSSHAHQQAGQIGPSFTPPGVFHPKVGTNGTSTSQGTAGEAELWVAKAQDQVDQLIRNFRVRGHFMASLDPLGRPRRQVVELDPLQMGFSESDLDRPFSTTSIEGSKVSSLREIVQRLRNTYCRSIGAQFMHIDDLEVRSWLQKRMEGTENRLELSRDEQLRIFTRLTDAAIFEEFILKKYVGAKTFSLQGAESLIPLLDLAFDKAGEQGVEEIVMAMAHRGRLNVMANILGKSPRQIFREFEDTDPHLHKGQGDVKYHLGYNGEWKAQNGKKISASLCFNPSHLEFVNTVALGRCRARQDRLGDDERERVLSLIIHGDAAFAGEGMAQETLNLSELKGYRVGGALHILINNQIGFTTPPEEGRSSTYATDVAKMLQIPIFHVNGEDPESVAQVIRLAMDFRKTFHRDVIIDMYCYRLHGHNESDEPAFTQPLMYDKIRNRQSVHETYRERLLSLGKITRDEAENIGEMRRKKLEKELKEARKDDYQFQKVMLGPFWEGYHGGSSSEYDEVDTGIPQGRLTQLMHGICQVPDDFTPHRTVKRLLSRRKEMADGTKPIDWGMAESTAFATLVTEGHHVRLSGEDSGRATFSQRHSTLYDFKTGELYVPLQHLDADQAAFNVFNSPLSESGVLGFDYGYSLDWPDGLVLWEAQFGDFVNAAQVIIDQFIASAEDKWQRLSGIVLLLPHGFEGMGPEHSSARLERFLNLAAEDNMQICNCTTPAQYFHLLRRQVIRKWRKPLVVMTPKSLLRHPKAISSLNDLSSGRFQSILPEADESIKPENVKRVLMCSGKVYYDLVERREKEELNDVAILRVEQLYPLAKKTVRAALKPYAAGTPVRWVQEEPSNMGAWWYLRVRFGDKLFDRWPFDGVSRPESASPATGSASSHKLEQQHLLDQAFQND